MAQLWDVANKFDEIGSVYFEDSKWPKWEHLVQEEIGLDEEDLEDFADIEQAYCSYKELLPVLFGDRDSMAPGERSFSLYHEDLRSANRIIDPSTYEVTGIIDWEQATTIPDWYGIDYPALLRGPDPFDEYDGQNTPVTYDSEDEKYNAATVSAGDRRDGQLLRKRFGEAMGKLGRKDWNHKSPLDELKSTFIEGVAALGDVRAGKRTLKQIRESIDRLEKAGMARKPEHEDTLVDQSEGNSCKHSNPS